MMFDKVLSLIRQEKGAVDVFTVIECNPRNDMYIGKMMIVYDSGEVDSQLEPAMTDKILNMICGNEWRKPVTHWVEDVSGVNYRLFWDRLVARPRALVFGGGHVSQPLVQILSLINFDVTVIDDRSEFANASRFPSAHIICESFDRAVKKISIDGDSAVIIVTRGHRFDLDCLRATMNSTAKYIGMIGSKKRVRECLGLLKEEGAPPDLAGRLRAPIGLDIQAQTPAEIAVSIAAEVIAVFRGGSCRPMSQGEGAL